MARSLTTRSTNPKIMDDNIKILDDALAGVETPDAEDVSYDNTDSGLTATNVQGAIDEVYGDIPNLETPSGVTLTLVEGNNFTINKMDIRKFGDIGLIMLRLQTSASITANSEIKIGTFSGLNYIGYISGATISNTNTSLNGGFVVNSSNDLYVNFTSSLSANTTVLLTIPCFILNS